MKHMRTSNDRPVHVAYAAMLLAFLLVVGFAAIVSPASTITAAPTPAPEQRSSCWHPPYQLDQPSELVCALRLPTKG